MKSKFKAFSIWDQASTLFVNIIQVNDQIQVQVLG